ncbi:hypothetical protein HYY69_02335 [Candidatus Woesearchaeota archaeon]|nr:hypothetical protein [Candidatus Woesearchaeota archaeon]
MGMKTIKISEENYTWLVSMAGKLQKETGHSVSIDSALKTLKERPTSQNIMNLAGSWKMTDKEVKEMKNSLRKGWKKWKTFA